MRVSDLRKAIAHLPDDATINANNNDDPNEFSIGCVLYNHRLKVVLLANDASECSVVGQILWNEAGE
jgi:hypothetical protein